MVAVHEHRAAVVFDEQERQRLIADAATAGAIYEFQSTNGKVPWLMGRYAYLWANGCISLLRRIGIRTTMVTPEESRFYPVAFTAQALLHEGREVAALPPGLFQRTGEVLQGQRQLPSQSSNFSLGEDALRVRELLSGTEAENLVSRPWHPSPSVLVIRHDTDISRDTTYLNYEVENHVPATYAIIKGLQEHHRFWLKRLQRHSDLIEVSWHWSSLGRIPYLTRNSPSKPQSTGRGISRQATEGTRNIERLSTIHKHGDAFYFPETIEAMDDAYRHHPQLLGMGTMFGWHMIQWDQNREGQRQEHRVHRPAVTVPLWFPYHLVLTTTTEYRALPGWDTSLFMEPSPETIDSIFDFDKRLPGGVYVVCYHPAHARKDSFSPGGCFPWYRYLIERARKASWWIATYRDVLERLNQWEATDG